MADPAVGGTGEGVAGGWGEAGGGAARRGCGAPARMAVFILYPFLSEGELQVLVNLSKVRSSTC